MDGTGQYAGANTSAAWSGSIWADCPAEALRDGQVPGYLWEKNFNTIPGGAIPTTEGAFGDGALFSSTGGTLVKDTTEVGGGWAVGSDGADEGVGWRAGGAPVRLGLSNGDFWFEARVLTSTVGDTLHDLFVGLMEDTALTAVVPITAADALADKNLVGFFRGAAAGGGAKLDAVYKTDGNAQGTIAAAGTLAAGTYTNLGMKFAPKRNYGKGAGSFTWFQDGAAVASYVVTSTAGNPFPNDINLGFVFAVLNSGASAQGTSTLKKVRIAQLLNALP